MAKIFWAADYYVLLQWNVRPAVMERTSCCCGTYVLLLWDVCPAAVERNNPPFKKSKPKERKCLVRPVE